MVILSSVIASIISEIGLGSDPTFTVPEYDFRSPSGTFLPFNYTNVMLKKIVALSYISNQLPDVSGIYGIPSQANKIMFHGCS